MDTAEAMAVLDNGDWAEVSLFLKSMVVYRLAECNDKRGKPLYIMHKEAISAFLEGKEPEIAQMGEGEGGEHA